MYISRRIQNLTQYDNYNNNQLFIAQYEQVTILIKNII